MPIKIIGAPIARDAQGLALSSRNAYFDKTGLTLARKLNVIMKKCAADMRDGQHVDKATDAAKAALIEAGFSSVDYVEVRSPNSLTVLEGGYLDGPARVLVAAHCPNQGQSVYADKATSCPNLSDSFDKVLSNASRISSRLTGLAIVSSIPILRQMRRC